MNALECAQLVSTLAQRFNANRHRHPGIVWDDVLARLNAKPAALKALLAMEESAGEPDVFAQDRDSGELTFCDFSKQSPQGRRSLCYDRQALDARKEHKPSSSVADMAQLMGVELLTEAQYRALQALEDLDSKTSSWVKTPDSVRALGGALFCDRRYGMVFVYHNGAESYYAARGFRAALRI